MDHPTDSFAIARRDYVLIATSFVCFLSANIICENTEVRALRYPRLERVFAFWSRFLFALRPVFGRDAWSGYELQR